jgi:hypothetical protein
LLPPSSLFPHPQAFELRLWPEQHPLRQFEQQLSYELLRKLEDRNLSLDMLAVSELAHASALRQRFKQQCRCRRSCALCIVLIATCSACRGATLCRT